MRTLGFSLTDTWQIGVQLGLVGAFDAAPSSTLLADVQYHWAPDATITPYVGAHGGVDADVFTDSPRAHEAMGPQLGAKWRWGDKLWLIAELRYTLQASHPSRGVALLCVGLSVLDDPHGSTPSASTP